MFEDKNAMVVVLFAISVKADVKLVERDVELEERDTNSVEEDSIKLVYNKKLVERGAINWLSEEKPPANKSI